MQNNLIEKAKKYVYAEKMQGWEQDAAKADVEVLGATVYLMEMMDGGYNFKKVDEVMNAYPQEMREQILRLLVNYADKGPEYAYDRLYKSQHGKVDRNNEYVQGLLYKMDQNDILRGKEKE